MVGAPARRNTFDVVPGDCNDPLPASARRNPSIRRRGMLALALSLGFFLSGCDQAKGGMPAMPPPEVTAVSVTPADVDGQLHLRRPDRGFARSRGACPGHRHRARAAVRGGPPGGSGRAALPDRSGAVRSGGGPGTGGTCQRDRPRGPGAARSDPPEAADRPARGQPARVRRRALAPGSRPRQRSAGPGATARIEPEPGLHAGHRRRSPA